jgi:hypothetical protein
VSVTAAPPALSRDAVEALGLDMPATVLTRADEVIE